MAKRTKWSPPSDDFGKVRERKVPIEAPLKPILPNPHRDLSFSSLTGWHYRPWYPCEDRLGMGRLMEDEPSTTIVVPEPWKATMSKTSSMAMDSITQQVHDLAKVSSLDGLPPITATGLPDDMGRGRLFTLAVPPVNDDIMSPQQVHNFSEVSSRNGLPPITATGLADDMGRGKIFTLAVPPVNDDIMSPVIRPPEKAKAVDHMEISNKPSPAGKVAPKAELHVFYGKKPRRIQLSPKNYLTWDNGRPQHELKYTSAFICPITKEVFLSGAYGDTYFRNGLCWYSKKILSEHAAAARALDCFWFREGIDKRVGQDTPYHKNDAPQLPVRFIPSEVMNHFNTLQELGGY